MAIAPRSRSALKSAEELVDLVVATLDDGKAEDIAIIDLRGKSSMADHLVIATGGSNRHVGALADHAAEALKKAGQKLAIEGVPQCDWVLIDGGDIIVHLFRPEVRAFYNLEKMWGAGFRPELPGRPAVHPAQAAHAAPA
jgi:ribosome-associated protein